MEIYMPPFAAAVDAGILSIMCSYNKINGTYSCENDETLTVELKKYVGFSGWVMSDWGADHSTIPAATHGLDQQMPDSSFFGQALLAAVQAGTVPESRVDDMVVRILTALYAIGEFDHPVSGKITNDVTSKAHDTLTRTLAAHSTVLLKNNNNLLPLPKTGLKSVSVFNAPASRSVITGGGGSGAVAPKYQISVLTGVTAVLNVTGSVNITYYSGSSAQAAADLAKSTEVAICVMATTSHEGADRPNLALPADQVSICNAVGKAQPKTIAVVITPGAVITDWADNVAAVLVGFMPGQEEGNALADIIFGDVNPSAKLPVTFPNKENEVGFAPDEYPGVNGQEYYREHLNVGYRWYATHGVKPRYAFGFGLSYTTFTLSNLAVSGRSVSATLRNTGKVTGEEVVQLYLGFPASAGEPPIQLKGFQKISLTAGGSQVVTFTLNDKSLSIWDVTSHSWKVQSGTFTVYVGTSSEDLPLKQTVNFT
jgi:beta-glucosidase